MDRAPAFEAATTRPHYNQEEPVSAQLLSSPDKPHESVRRRLACAQTGIVAGKDRVHSLAQSRLQRIATVVLGLFWLIDGALQFQPFMFGKTFITGVILPNAEGQPGIIASPITWIAHLIEPRVALFNAIAATLQVLIGVGLLYRRTLKPALLLSFIWALGIWFTGEGLGGIFTGNASPLAGAPGAALLYVLVGLMCWPRTARSRDGRAHAGPAPLGLIGERGARLAWAALWLSSAAFWLVPANSGAGDVSSTISAVPSGAGWLSGILAHAASATAGAGSAIAVVMAIASAAIGLAVLRSWHHRAFLWLAIAISGLYWVVGQGLGGILTGQATDISTAPLVVLIAGVLLGLPERQASRRLRRERVLQVR